MKVENDKKLQFLNVLISTRTYETCCYKECRKSTRTDLYFYVTSSRHPAQKQTLVNTGCLAQKCLPDHKDCLQHKST